MQCLCIYLIFSTLERHEFSPRKVALFEEKTPTFLGESPYFSRSKVGTFCLKLFGLKM